MAFIKNLVANTSPNFNWNNMLGNLTAAQGLGSHGMVESDNNFIRKYEIYESKEDLLTLSCAWYRVRNNEKLSIKYSGISRLVDPTLFGIIDDEDIELTAKIRDYYSKKIMLWKIKNTELTKFREDLNQFIHSDGKKFIENVFGMVYRLPQFYFYDTKLDDIFRQGILIEDTMRDGKKSIKKIEFIDSTVLNTNRYKKTEYWFKDETGHIVGLHLDQHNPLLNIWEQLITSPLSLDANFFTRTKGDYRYLTADRYSLYFDKK